jgi:biopolymer transport protein ExbD
VDSVFRHTLTVLALLMTSPAASAGRDCAGPPIPVAIHNNGDIVWNGRYVAREHVRAWLYNVTRRSPMPNVHLVLTRRAHYDAVAFFLSEAQRTGFYCLGFTGIEITR